ncbi:MAG: hypothetical protein ACKOQM_00910 [Novosphingobium sp.]
MANRKNPGGGMKPDNALAVEQTAEETGAQATARKLVQPAFKNAVVTSSFIGKMIGGVELPGLADYANELQKVSAKAAEGDLAMASKLLTSQAVALDSMFAELARRCAINMGDYIDASERYGRLALKAQSYCRATLEALAKLHQPREQTVRHVHVNEGGQAVIADQFHNHTGGKENGETDEQPHTAGPAGSGPAMLGHDPQGNGVPIPGNQEREAVQDARRQGQRRA